LQRLHTAPESLTWDQCHVHGSHKASGGKGAAREQPEQALFGGC
jgi:hypothetical protein